MVVEFINLDWSMDTLVEFFGAWAKNIFPIFLFGLFVGISNGILKLTDFAPFGGNANIKKTTIGPHEFNMREKRKLGRRLYTFYWYDLNPHTIKEIPRIYVEAAYWTGVMVQLYNAWWWLNFFSWALLDTPIEKDVRIRRKKAERERRRRARYFAWVKLQNRRRKFRVNCFCHRAYGRPPFRREKQKIFKGTALSVTWIDNFGRGIL